MSIEKSSDFFSLDSQRSIDEFLNLTHCMHDCCISVFFWDNPMFVDSKGAMTFPKRNFPGQSNLTVIFQSQILTGYAVELKRAGVDYLECCGVNRTSDGIILAARLTLENCEKVTFICNPDDTPALFVVKAKNVFWRLRKDLVGALSASIKPSLSGSHD